MSIDLSLEVHADTFISVRKAESVHHHDEDENDGSRHGEPNDVRGRLNSLEYAEVSNEPGEEESKCELPGEVSRLVFGASSKLLGVINIAFNNTIFVLGSNQSLKEVLEEPFLSDVVLVRRAFLELRAGNSGVTLVVAVLTVTVLVSLCSLDRPRSRVVEDRGNEVDQGNGNQVGVEDVDGKCREHRSQSNTVQLRVDSTEHTNVTTLEQLSKGELKQHHGKTQEEESKEVGNEEDTSSPLVSQVRETPEVTETNGRSNSSENEGNTASPSLSRSSSNLIFISE